MKDILEEIKKKASDKIAMADNVKLLEELRVKYLGKKGELTTALKKLGDFPLSERSIVGELANKIKIHLKSLLGAKTEELNKFNLSEKLKSETIDVTMSGAMVKIGSKHPLKTVLDEVKEMFLGMGFNVVQGPEIEWDYYNFDMLNTPKGHPAREESDTFFIADDLLLRTQTSTVQARYMQTHKPPIKIIAPGRVYRADEIDQTHSPVFNQIEGLVVGENISMANLKNTLETFVKKLYGNNAKIRLRPHHFPFTEPSAEVDLCCFACNGKGCRMCKGEGWVEILGAGMVHPNVFSACEIDNEKYSGFAFGIGLERIVMYKYSIDDMRLFFENDIRFLEQF